jgi:hypothetical protein
MLRKIALCLSFAAAACGPASRLSAPDGFARLGGDQYDDRIGTASGVVVATRVVPNEPRANLDFWTTAIDLRLRQRGYEPSAAPKDVKNDAGLPGRELRYTFFDGARKNDYFLDVYATDRRILLVEAAGDAAQLDASAPTITKTMRSARLGS